MKNYMVSARPYYGENKQETVLMGPYTEAEANGLFEKLREQFHWTVMDLQMLKIYASPEDTFLKGVIS
jgi:hypothetical protein